MNDLKYFRNDKLDLVNKEKQRFGFRKLSSGKIASVLLGVTIFGSFALNGQVVKANTTTDGSQPTAVVDEAKSKQNKEEEQSGQDPSTRKDSGSRSSLTITTGNLGREETTEADQGTQDTQTADKTAEAKIGKTQTDSPGIDTKKPNREGITSDKNGARATNVRIARSAAMQLAARIPVNDQPTAEKIAKKYTHIDVDHAQKILDYYNNIGTITKILNLNSSTYSYGGPWLEGIIGLTTSNVKTFTNSYVDGIVGIYTANMVRDTQAKIDERIKNLQDLSSQYPNNQKIKDAINKLTDIKDSVTASNITNAKAMENAIDTLDHYGSDDAYNKLLVNKTDLKTEIDTAKALADDPKYYNSTNKDAFDKALSDAENVYGNDSASQQDVDDAKNALEAAKKALDGTETKKTELQSAYDTDTAGNATDPKYYNASEAIKQKYDEALKAAKDVLDNGSATQTQVDDAKNALEAAKKALDGKTTDKDALQSAVDAANTTKLDDKYYNASQDKKQAYDEALAQAAKLLNDKTASQKAVDDAVANLEKAKAELNGEPNFIGGDYTPSEPSTPSTETPAEKTTEKILMHASYLYDNKGIKIDKPTVKSYVTVVVAENPVTINGIKYYKVAGKDEYIKAGNIDGTLRVITHNSYIYNNKGKATRNKGIKRLVKKTRIVRTYGAPINIKGHMMYRIAKNRYIKARNFEGTLRRLSHNSFVYDENGKATRNKGIRRLLKKSRVVRTFDAPVKIKGHMMYRVDNGYIKVKNIK